MHIVYILYSFSIEQYYCGETANLIDRLSHHNAGRSKSTKRGIPWELVKVIECKNSSEARVLEKQIKGRGIKRWLEDNS